jgi:MSHA biogenesis protein MshP
MKPPRQQRGFGLIAALFVVVLALLVVLAAVLTLNARSRSTVQALDASRALAAANSGLEIAIARSLAGGCAAVPATLTIEGFEVQLACTAFPADEAPITYDIFRLTASAQRGRFSDGTFVSRTVRATVTQ